MIIALALADAMAGVTLASPPFSVMVAAEIAAVTGLTLKVAPAVGAEVIMAVSLRVESSALVMVSRAGKVMVAGMFRLVYLPLASVVPKFSVTSLAPVMVIAAKAMAKPSEPVPPIPTAACTALALLLAAVCNTAKSAMAAVKSSPMATLTAAVTVLAISVTQSVNVVPVRPLPLTSVTKAGPTVCAILLAMTARSASVNSALANS